MPQMGGVEAGIKLLEICLGTKIVLVYRVGSPKTLGGAELSLPGASCTF
jgi:hypothetical protein